jgi:hypothetical protein
VSGSGALWVFNASRAAAGTAVRCDGTDPNCVNLTNNLFLDSSQNDLGLGMHAFDGDTLIYYGETGPAFMAGNGFIGTIYAWRPGWTAGRPLTSNSGLICHGQAKAAVALCFDNPVAQTAAGAACTANTDCVDVADLRTGQLPAAGGALLPKIEPVIFQAPADAAGVNKFQPGFSPDGTYAVWSARLTQNGPETLRALRIGDAAATTIATNISIWAIAPDSSRWYWLRMFNYDVNGAPSGTLQADTFPAGGAPVTLAQNVGDYFTAGPKGILFQDAFSGGRANLKLMPDRDTFAAVTTLDTGVAGPLAGSVDGTKVAYYKNVDTSGQLSDLYLAGTGITRCTLTASPTSVGSIAFLASGGGVAWQNAVGSATAQGMFTNVATCTTNAFAASINPVGPLSPVGDQGFIYGDDAPTNFGTSTVRYSRIACNMLPPGTPLEMLTDPIFAPLWPSLSAVVYVIPGTGAQQGLYINGPLPFTAQ